MHTIKDALGDRMKAYENISRNYLTRKIPVIIRVDGKAFHSFTKGFERPFDKVFMEAMQQTMKYLCENIQGCVLGYTQSDEITLVLTDYANINTDAWFGYNIQKMASVAASMATMAFNKYFEELVDNFYFNTYKALTNKECNEWYNTYSKVLNTAMFDARCFSIPKEEVINCLIWRQQDATRNSILSVAQSVFSHKEMQGISCKDLQNKMLSEKDINWNDYSIPEKRGTCCIKKLFEIRRETAGDLTAIIERPKWIIDKEIPIFTENRYYIESLI